MAIRNARTGVNISDANAAVSEVAAGKTFYSVAVPKKTGTMASVTLDHALNAYPTGHHAGAPSLTAVDSNLIPSNIKLGKMIFGVVGTMVQWLYDQVMPILSIPAPSITLTRVEDHSGGGQIDTHNLGILTPALALAAVQATISAVGGGVAHKQTGSLDTDETAQTNNATANDMDLLPASGNSTGDGFYFGFAALWDALAIIVGTAGAGTYTITWKYWNGAAWVALTIKQDETNNFKTIGTLHLNFARPGDWAVTTIAGIANLYWIKAECTFTSMTTQPKGTRAWILTY